ncbi:hypothetical protein EGR_09964 [Echinococcus granulosus]|uniref:Uncharacterized protein n=1 Tax=Echinococcus granulosus TaxID=6210 RepID=W6U9K9_ECHGR|nr:hypothetical protein EGR_09964 [Echinococcus granulosus]EUB55182.1 hypothetical protein EGR_09964 [Echinococcus granulosus]
MEAPEELGGREKLTAAFPSVAPDLSVAKNYQSISGTSVKVGLQIYQIRQYLSPSQSPNHPFGRLRSGRRKESVYYFG